MAILRAAATANDTLDQTGDTLINSLTLTPASDDYLLFATVEFVTASASGTEDTIFSVYVGGVQVDHTERIYGEDTSIDSANIVYALNCKVSPNGSQAVEIRYRTAAADDPLIASTRELTLFPIPAAGTDYEKSATANDTIASATYATLNSMTETPAADDYLLVFSTSCRGPNGTAIGFKVVVGGTDVAHTQRITEQESSAWDSDNPILIACKVSPNGSQTVDIEWARTQGTGTVTCGPRTMNLIPLDSGDIFEASGTTNDADSTTTDKQVDDLLITDPGAADYLCIFSGYQSYGSIGSGDGETTFSLRTAGTKVTDSDRINEVENSLDNTFLCCAAGGRVTVAGATDDLQVYWQGQSTATRTIHERTFIAIREATVGAIDAVLPIVTAVVADLKATGKLDATVALVFAQTADLKAIGKLDAVLPIISNATADLKAGGELDAILPIVFAQASDLKAKGKLDVVLSVVLGTIAALSSTNEIDASLSIIHDVAASLTSRGKLDAALPIVTDITADLKGRGGLNSALPIVFGIAGELVADGKLDAVLPTVFNTTADLRATGKLDAVLNTIFGTGAALTGTGKLDATPPIVFGITAALSDASGGAISASLPIVTTVASDLNASGKLDAAIALAFTIAADLNGKGKLDATLPIAFTPTASLTSDGKLDAVLPIVTTIAADLTSIGKLDAVAPIVAAIVADLKARGVLTATPSLVFNAVADLKAKGQLAAALPITFSTVAAIIDASSAIFYHVDITGVTRGITITPFAGRIN